ncbi:MAG: RNA polymerase sigma factor [Chromatiaceae bacterium]|nr:RNA polymerase sigma factor [Gammaproteobacteria bacterium]MCP5428503.1 RNA polymerase sigma factor [Chromatiaceae bacterium]MCP5447438.1 RNA polymerase sigma factor [Chromatiaceae bacterium]
MAAVMHIVRDLALAEELVQDALVRALEKWREQGVPENPAGWLLATARNRAIDTLRRQANFSGIQRQLSDELPSQTAADAVEAAAEAVVDDDVLRLMFTVCHPLLSPEARVALVLRLVNGLSIVEIARAYLVPEATVAQRITRAKRTLKAAHVPFELPPSEHRGERLQSVLEAVYLLFNAGYAATDGEQWLRPTLCDEALRLARSLASLVPEDAEVLGLAALLEFQASRSAARVDSDGTPILLQQQDRARWDRLMIHRGGGYLQQAFALGQPVGSYCIQAAIAQCHARAGSWQQTDWEEVAALYDGLLQAQPSPVTELNRAVAIGMADGPDAGLQIVEALLSQGQLSTYHLLFSVRGDLLLKLGRLDEARSNFLRAAEMTRNKQEKKLLQRRATECAAASPASTIVPH